MKHPHHIAWVLLGLLLPCIAHAQFQRQPGQGAVGGGGGAVGGDTTRQYYNSTMVGEAMISADPETRRLIVITDEETSQHISQIITNLDRPKPQVLIKVLFLEVTYRDGYDIGLEGAVRRDLGGSSALLASNIFGLANQGVFPAPPGAGFYQIIGTDYQATLRAIATAGKTEVLSRPSILARNNQQAIITVGSEVPFITDSRITENDSTINTVEYQDVGIILRVTPFITSDGLVEMIVSPEISTLTDQTVTISPGVEAPVIAKRSADTVVVTADGQTIIIGGLMENNKATAESKIPVLGDIPLLGALFRRKIKDHSKTELMIFLTPHIVLEPSQMALITQKERESARLAPQSFTDDQIDRYIDNLSTREEIDRLLYPESVPNDKP